MTNEMLILNIKGLVQVRQSTSSFLAGSAQAELPILPDAFLLIKDGVISDYGSMNDLADQTVPLIDASGCYVFPSLSIRIRILFTQRVVNMSLFKDQRRYIRRIASKGGGILNSARVLQNTTEDRLLELAIPEAWEIIRSGTGAVEIKEWLWSHRER